MSEKEIADTLIDIMKKDSNGALKTIIESLLKMKSKNPKPYTLIPDETISWRQLPTSEYTGKYSSKNVYLECRIDLICRENSFISEFSVLGYSNGNISLSIDNKYNKMKIPTGFKNILKKYDIKMKNYLMVDTECRLAQCAIWNYIKQNYDMSPNVINQINSILIVQ